MSIKHAYAPTGVEIVGTYEAIVGCTCYADVTKDEDGDVDADANHYSETKINWDGQVALKVKHCLDPESPLFLGGLEDANPEDCLYIDENRQVWAESSLIWKEKKDG